jgi:hypothetical protein
VHGKISAKPFTWPRELSWRLASSAGRCAAPQLIGNVEQDAEVGLCSIILSFENAHDAGAVRRDIEAGESSRDSQRVPASRARLICWDHRTFG